jgi:hypothetical protein
VGAAGGIHAVADEVLVAGVLDAEMTGAVVDGAAIVAVLAAS